MTRLRWDALLVYDGPDRATAAVLVRALASPRGEVGWDELVEAGGRATVIACGVCAPA